MIFEGDDIDQTTESFAKLHCKLNTVFISIGLPEHKKIKLLTILKKQVSQLLTAHMPESKLL